MRDITRKSGIRDIAPSDKTLIITDPRIAPVGVKWGYEGRNGQLIFNARAESIKGKPMFGRDYMKRRCVIPAMGFYEWDKDKRRYSFTDGSGEQELYLAGICTGLPGGDGRFTVLTVDANEQMSDVHPRMPVLIKKHEFALWFGTVETADELLAEKIQGKQSLSKKIDLEIDEKKDTIEIYVQQNLMNYIEGQG